MSYPDHNDRIPLDKLDQFGRRRYHDFDRTHSRMQHEIDQTYGSSNTKRQALVYLFAVAAAGLLLLVVLPLLRGQDQSTELLLSESTPLPTLTLSGLQSEAVSPESSQELRTVLSHYSLGQYETAANELGQLVGRDQTDELYLYLGHALYMNQEWQSAERSLEKAGELLSGRSAKLQEEVNYWLAKSRLAQGHCDKAAPVLRSLMATMPLRSEHIRKLLKLCA